MTDPSPGRPLVTFALFAYNQEQFIHEAVEGAFAQTYEPLEIILSDDCSSDQTYQIMQKMAAEYNGPHKVRVRKNDLNLGTALHVGTVAATMKGSLMIVAAGDDISNCERCTTLVSAWNQAGRPIAVIHSAASSYGSETFEGSKKIPLRTKIDQCVDLKWLMRENRTPFLSPTCAYSKEIFSEFPPILGGSLIEDSVLAFRSLLIGQSIAVDVPLVEIREVADSTGRGNLIASTEKWNTFIRSKIVSRLNRIQDLQRSHIARNSLHEQYEILLLRETQRLSKLFIPKRKFLSTFNKNRFFLLLLIYYPGGKFSYRVLYALIATGLNDTVVGKNIIYIGKLFFAKKH